MSQCPCSFKKFCIIKKKQALKDLHISLKDEQWQELKSSLKLNKEGLVTYGDFVQKTREILQKKKTSNEKNHTVSKDERNLLGRVDSLQAALDTERKYSRQMERQNSALKTKIKLAGDAQRAARETEEDYERVVRMMEKEIAKLKNARRLSAFTPDNVIGLKYQIRIFILSQTFSISFYQLVETVS